ncbi:MAG: archease [Dehalococcoidia bacterium]|nr:archease [Dehalococcoidia bacterium]MDW8009476.1 archease [Chloroflexota bacterium]HXG42365.1 archease [Dehalococcoidia bacterium]
MAEAPPPYEVLEHTADVRVVARGRTLEELFANAALAMSHLVAELDGVAERERQELEAEAHDWESLLVRWLNELLYWLDAKNMLFRRFEMLELAPYRLRAVAWGERLDPQRHQLRVGIKGVTRHLLQVSHQDGWWQAQVVFDI